MIESNFGWWNALFESYLETYRPLIVASSSKKKGNDDHNFVFMTRHGTPFAANYFSDFLSTLPVSAHGTACGDPHSPLLVRNPFLQL